MIEQSQPYREDHTLINADAGYHSDANVQYLKDQNIAAMIADNQMRPRDERFEGQARHKDKLDPLSEKAAAGQPKEAQRFRPKDFSERMCQPIDSPRCRQLYSQRIGTVEPVFGNIRHKERLTRLN